MKELEEAIFHLRDQADFEQLALRIFEFQSQKVDVYRNYLNYLGKGMPKSVAEIPFLPIEFFKSEVVLAQDLQSELLFKSSGTTGQQRSIHYVAKARIYEESFSRAYRQLIGNPEEQVILALLPNYLEQGESSLVYMIQKLIEQSRHPLSSFYKDEHQELIRAYQQVISEGKQAVVFGVSYALLDLCDSGTDLSQAIVVETGGMKGRRKELTKEELHRTLCQAFATDTIYSEYGMTELLSQGYSQKNGLFQFPNWMQIKLRDVNDPFDYVENGKTGGINVIDLANLYSCSFIATQDLGKWTPDGLKLMGRFDHSDIRGCNLLVD
ncbi:MAG: acyl transferase [Bacteroidetes bacterium]|nr:MAG: acyl transferase [Bacteroidota bacterium]